MKNNSNLPKTELRRQAEAKLSERKKKATVLPATESDTRRLVYELEVHQIELEMQNEELLQSRAQVEAGLRQYTDLYDFAPVGYFSLARDGAILQVNLAGANLLGVEHGALIKRRFGVFVSARSRTTFSAFLEKVFSTSGSKETCEIALQEDGSALLWVHIEAITKDGQSETCRAVVVDITRRKRAEQEIEVLARFPSENPNPVLRVELDGKINYANPASEALLRLWNCAVRDYLPPDWRERVVNAVRHSTSTTVDVECEARFYSVMVVPIPDAGYVNIYARDITERKRTEKALQENEKRYRELFDLAPIGYHELDIQGRITQINRTGLDMLGYTKEEMIGQFGWKFVADEEASRQRVLDKLKGIISPTKGEERTYRRKDGATTPVLVENRILRDAANRIVGIRTTLQDITKRKQTEEALREREEHYRLLVESLPDGVIVHCQGRVVFANPASATIIGAASPADLTGKPVIEFVHPDYRELALKRIRQSLSERVLVPLAEEKFVRMDGTQIDVEVSAIPFSYAGKPALLTVFNDITERKRAEEALHSASLYTRSLIEAGLDPLVTISPEGKITDVNRATEAVTGVAREQLIGSDFSEYFTEPEKARAGYQQVLAEGLVRDYPIMIRNISGKTTDVLYNATVYKNEAGQVQGVFAAAHDITELKRAEKALRKSENSLNEAQRVAHIGSWEWDTTTDIITWSEEYYHIYGFDPRQRPPGYEEHLVAYTQESATRLDAAVKRNVQTGESYELDLELALTDGSSRWITARSETMRDKNGQIVGLRGTAQDVTARKQAEETLTKLKKAIETSGEAIFLTDKKGIFTYLNPGFTATYGYPAAELIGKVTPRILKIGSIGQDPYEVFWKTLFSGQEVRGEHINKSKDGRLINIDGSATPIFDEKKNIIGFLGIQRDITERKKMEEKLRESEEYYRTLIETTPDAIVIIDTEGMITFASSKMYKVFDIPANQSVRGTSFLTWVHPDEHDNITKRLHEILSQGVEPEVREYHLLKFDETPFWGEISKSPLLNAHGTVIGALLMCRDVTEKKKLRQELVQSQKLQSIGTLAGGIAHDFNNVLAIILGYTSFLEIAAIPPEKKAEAIVVIKNAVQRGAALVRQILTFARKSEVLFEPMNLADLLHELLSMLQQTFPKTVTFKEVIEKELPLISADRTQMHQALLNLCVNARDAMPKGGCVTFTMEKKTGEELRERFPAAEMESYLCLAVADTGEGMTDATRSKIFDPFFTTKERGRGTGLGLSVVFGVVQAHHGFIDVESVVGRGTTFRLYFPFSLSGKITHAPQKQEDPIEFGGTETILLVEDEESLIEMARLTLESHGYHVYVAQDGPKAVEMYRIHHNEIALVVSGIGLPGMTGIDVFKTLKEMNPNVKLIFVTGFIEPEVKSRLLEAGAKGFIQKPYTPREMLQGLRAVLEE